MITKAATLGILLASSAVPAYGQTASDGAPQSAATTAQADVQSGDAAIGDIIVTAQRRSESLQRVPASVGVVSGDQLRAAHVTSLASLQELSPSLIVTQTSNPSAGSFTVRGVGSPGAPGFEQAVGVYIDGVYRGRPGSALRELLDIDRVEILRGPQSTLFGRNNAAGAINIATALPDRRELRVYGEATYGNYDAVQARLSVSVPLVEGKLAVRLSVVENKRDGFITAFKLPDGRLNAIDHQSSRGQMYWTPTPTTSIRLIADYSQADDACCSYQTLFISDAAVTPPPSLATFRGLFLGYTPPTAGVRGGSPSDAAVPGTLFNPFARLTYQDNRTGERSKDKGVSLQIDQDVGALTVTAIGSIRRFQAKSSIDIDGVDSKIASSQSNVDDATTEKSAELRVQNAAGSPVEFIVGGYYFNQHLDLGNLLQVSLPTTTIDFYNSTARQRTNSGAVFGQATVRITDALKVTGGLRYLKETKDSVTTVAPGTSTFAGTADTDNSALMGTGVIAYQPSTDANFYVRYARGFKSATINPLITISPTIASQIARPETSDAYEVGAKLRLIGNILTSNVAIFTQTYRDQQVQAFNGVAFNTLNAAKVRSRGVEAELRLKPVRPLTLNVALNYLDSKYVSFAGAPARAGSLATSQDLTGQTPLNAPRWTVVTGAAVSQPLSDAVTLNGNVSLRHATGYFTELTNSPAFRNGVTNVLDASLEFELRRGFAISVWGRNLTRQDYYLSGFATGGGSGSLVGYVNDPRTYGMTLRFRK